MKKHPLWIAASLLVLTLAGCATPGEKAPDERAAPGVETAPAPDRAVPPGRALTEQERLRAELLAKRRVHFAFDSSAIDEEARAIIEAHAAHLRANPGIQLMLEGHCDERGTREYNLGLGERRAQSVERLLRVLGVDGSRIATVSYGEERPMCTERNESCWRLNRRVEIIYR